MAGIPCVALAVAGFIPLEVVECPRSAIRHWARIAKPGIVAVVHVAIKAARAVEPGAGPDEQSAVKPVWAIVAIGRTAIRGVVIVAIGALWGHADANHDLGGGCGRCGGCGSEQYSSSDGGKSERF
jgi:hypothetical protein